MYGLLNYTNCQSKNTMQIWWSWFTLFALKIQQMKILPRIALQMTANWLGVKNPKKCSKKILVPGSKNAGTYKYSPVFPKIYMIETVVYKRFKRTLVHSNWL